MFLKIKTIIEKHPEHAVFDVPEAVSDAPKKQKFTLTAGTNAEKKQTKPGDKAEDEKKAEIKSVKATFHTMRQAITEQSIGQLSRIFKNFPTLKDEELLAKVQKSCQEISTFLVEKEIKEVREDSKKKAQQTQPQGDAKKEPVIEQGNSSNATESDEPKTYELVDNAFAGIAFREFLLADVMSYACKEFFDRNGNLKPEVRKSFKFDEFLLHLPSAQASKFEQGLVGSLASSFLVDLGLSQFVIMLSKVFPDHARDKRYQALNSFIDRLFKETDMVALGLARNIPDFVFCDLEKAENLNKRIQFWEDLAKKQKAGADEKSTDATKNKIFKKQIAAADNILKQIELFNELKKLKEQKADNIEPIIQNWLQIAEKNSELAPVILKQIIQFDIGIDPERMDKWQKHAAGNTPLAKEVAAQLEICRIQYFIQNTRELEDRQFLHWTLHLNEDATNLKTVLAGFEIALKDRIDIQLKEAKDGSDQIHILNDYLRLADKMVLTCPENYKPTIKDLIVSIVASRSPVKIREEMIAKDFTGFVADFKKWLDVVNSSNAYKEVKAHLSDQLELAIPAQVKKYFAEEKSAEPDTEQTIVLKLNRWLELANNPLTPKLLHDKIHEQLIVAMNEKIKNDLQLKQGMIAADPVQKMYFWLAVASDKTIPLTLKEKIYEEVVHFMGKIIAAQFGMIDISNPKALADKILEWIGIAEGKDERFKKLNIGKMPEIVKNGLANKLAVSIPQDKFQAAIKQNIFPEAKQGDDGPLNFDRVREWTKLRTIFSGSEKFGKAISAGLAPHQEKITAGTSKTLAARKSQASQSSSGGS